MLLDEPKVASLAAILSRTKPTTMLTAMPPM